MTALALEVFDDPSEPKAGSTPDPAGDELRLAVYEQGYAAGWEDAQSAMAGDQTRIATDLARNLQALSFTYHEARGHVLRGLGPLLELIVTRLLPQIAHESLPFTVLETLMEAAEKSADVPIILLANPAARPAIEKLLDHATGLPLTLRDEPSLGEGQVYLQFAEAELQVDLDQAVADMSAAVRNFFALEQGT
jgi:flagellar biosynthesis/type III secretory pathway protein FliH